MGRREFITILGGVAAHGMRTAAAASCERIDGNSRR